MFDLPDNAKEIENLGSVALPFIAPLIYWKNGTQALENMDAIKGVQRFGGWAIQTDQIDPFPTLPELPPSFELTELSGGEGKYKNYLSRSIEVAVISRRFAWFDKSVTQYLAYMKDFGPVILQAKGLGGLDLDDAVNKFKKVTANARQGVTDQFFYMPLGTFGPKPVFVKKESKVKKGEGSFVTVPDIYVPKDGFNSANIQYVGKETAGEIVNIQKQAKEWLADWNKRNGKKQDSDGLPPLPDGIGFEPIGADADDIPDFMHD